MEGCLRAKRIDINFFGHIPSKEQIAITIKNAGPLPIDLLIYFPNHYFEQDRKEEMRENQN
jgi:hypothetical protein